MARYIDVEPLEDKLKEHIRKTESELMLGALSTFLRLLDITPTADVAPVVRCEECKHLVVLNARDLYAHCKRHDIRFEPFEYDTRTNYCSWAERKDDEIDRR